jgi:hypothetical protein
MSSDVVDRVLAHVAKAEELIGKGQLFRAADYYGRAAEAADALEPGRADNLAAVDMRLNQANALLTLVVAALVKSAFGSDTLPCGFAALF